MAQKAFTLKVNPDKRRFPVNRFLQLDQDGNKYALDPMEVPGSKPGKKLWEERLAECQQTNPACTFEDMCWGVADVPDEYCVLVLPPAEFAHEKAKKQQGKQYNSDIDRYHVITSKADIQ